MNLTPIWNFGNRCPLLSWLLGIGVCLGLIIWSVKVFFGLLLGYLLIIGLYELGGEIIGYIRYLRGGE